MKSNYNFVIKRNIVPILFKVTHCIICKHILVPINTYDEP